MSKSLHFGWHRTCLFPQSFSETMTYKNQYFIIDFNLKEDQVISKISTEVPDSSGPLFSGLTLLQSLESTELLPYQIRKTVKIQIQVSILPLSLSPIYSHSACTCMNSKCQDRSVKLFSLSIESLGKKTCSKSCMKDKWQTTECCHNFLLYFWIFLFGFVFEHLPLGLCRHKHVTVRGCKKTQKQNERFLSLLKGRPTHFSTSMCESYMLHKNTSQTLESQRTYESIWLSY